MKGCYYGCLEAEDSHKCCLWCDDKCVLYDKICKEFCDNCILTVVNRSEDDTNE